MANHTYGESTRDFRAGDIVEAHPACDCWMMGDRFGVVSLVGRKYVSVRMTVSGRIRRFPADLLRIDNPSPARFG